MPSASVCTVNAALPDEEFPLVATRIWRFSSVTVRLISAPLVDSAYRPISSPETVISVFSPVTCATKSLLATVSVAPLSVLVIELAEISTDVSVTSTVSI